MGDLEGLKGERVALPRGTMVEERVRRDFPNLRVVLTASATGGTLTKTGKAWAEEGFLEGHLITLRDGGTDRQYRIVSFSENGLGMVVEGVPLTAGAADIDAIDAVRAKCVLLARCRDRGVPVVACGGAGGGAGGGPHPRAHALLADKRNLIALSQNELLLAWGASAANAGGQT